MYACLHTPMLLLHVHTDAVYIYKTLSSCRLIQYILKPSLYADCTKLLCTSSSKEAKLLCTSSSKEAMDPKATDSIASEGSSQNKSDSSATTALIVIAVILALLVLLCTVLLVISLSLLLLPRLKRKSKN